MRRSFVAFLIVVLTLCLLGGCTLVQLRKDVQFSKDSCLIFGEIISKAPVRKPVVVVVYAGEREAVAVGDYAVLSAPGPYELLVRDGRYRIFAFEDANDNLQFDPGERAGHYGRAEQVSTQAGGVLWGMDIELFATLAEPAPSLAGTLLAYSGGKRKPATSAGAIADLDDPAFSAERGEQGFWAPLEYCKLAGANIHFLEPYDPAKIPVLLVHGAAGSPRDWRQFLAVMDRSRYQPWIFSYPSGARLGTLSLFLRKKLYDLEQRYGFAQLYVVAHSMGGLIARSALIEPDQHNRAVKLFVSLSTPWGGEPRARTGVAHSPAVIPSWKDMEPDSDFIRAVFARKLPRHMRYYLFFGHRGGGSLFRQNNDNTVTLESMLDPRAQADALKVIGFNEDHTSILSSAEVISQYRAIVAATEENLKKGMAATHGYVDIRHRFLPADVTVPLQMAFVLVPADGDAPETQLRVNPSLARQETGAVAPGDYRVSLCALGFKTEPANHPLSVRAGKIAEVDFTLRPQGMVAGVIAAGTSADDSYWGYLRALPEKVRIRSIQLAGAGVSRLLRPADGMSDREVLTAFLASQDFAHKEQFAFFDVPAGEYRLSIIADGCEPHTAAVTVRPGEFTPPPPFRLTVR